jgi:hypothetical protein
VGKVCICKGSCWRNELKADFSLHTYAA